MYLSEMLSFYLSTTTTMKMHASFLPVIVGIICAALGPQYSAAQPPCTAVACVCPKPDGGSCPTSATMGNCCVHGMFAGSVNTAEDYFFTHDGVEYKCSEMPACPAELPPPTEEEQAELAAMSGLTTDVTTTSTTNVTESFESHTNVTEIASKECYQNGVEIPCDQIEPVISTGSVAGSGEGSSAGVMMAGSSAVAAVMVAVATL